MLSGGSKKIVVPFRTVVPTVVMSSPYGVCSDGHLRHNALPSTVDPEKEKG